MKKKNFIFVSYMSFMKRITVYLILLFLGASNFVQAQQPVATQHKIMAISGIVIDEKGESVVGASVREKGTTNGTITNVDGKFNLQVSEHAVIIVSSLGFHSVEQAIGNQQSFTVQLMEDTKLIDEVIVIGYGTMRKKDLTGAIGSLRSKDIGNISVVNVEQMIQGRVAGVDVINNSGLPGMGTSIKVRGVGTIYNSDPLYVVDGMPGDINSVSQYDIESI